MRVVVTNPSMPQPLFFTLNPHNTVETLRLRIDIETSLRRDGYALVLGDRELRLDETLRSLTTARDQDTLTVALVLCVQSGFIL